MDTIQESYNKFQTLVDSLGYEKLAKEMYHALNKDKANELFDYIARAYDVELNSI